MPGADRDVIEYARGRWLNDPEFHARATLAAELTAKECYTRRPSNQEMLALTTAAAFGLAMEWVDPQTGKILDT